MNYDDIVHISKFDGGYWTGKVSAIKDVSGGELVHISGIDSPGYASRYIKNLELIGDEWWDK